MAQNAAVQRNSLDQVLDIRGSTTAFSARNLADEIAGLGAQVQAGTGASVGAAAGGVSTVTGLTNMLASMGNFLSLSGGTPATNGAFMIVDVADATSVTIARGSGPAATGVAWSERYPYNLNDDLDFARTDRAAIKGVGFEGAIPTYERPTAIGTFVPANLSNLKGMTLDARGFVFTRKAPAVAVTAGATGITLTSAGNLKHADAVNKTGVPCFDTPPYVDAWNACYVDILSGVDGSRLVTAGGNNIFGRTQAAGLVSPNEVRIGLFSVPPGGDIVSQAVPYTWEASQPTSVDLFYGFFERLDTVSESALRTVQSLGVEESATLRQDVNDLQSVMGTPDSALSLAGLLTNTTLLYPFDDLPDAAPSVVEALNTLNASVGSRDYAGPQTYLTDGEPVAASLQSLANALYLLAGSVASSGVVRIVERLSGDVLANTEHAIPGGTYALDGTNNGLGLSVYTRGMLRVPGPTVVMGDYKETSTSSVTFFSKLLAGDFINYYIFS